MLDKSHHNAPADFDFYYLRDDLYQNKGLFVFYFQNLVRISSFTSAGAYRHRCRCLVGVYYLFSVSLEAILL